MVVFLHGNTSLPINDLSIKSTAHKISGPCYTINVSVEPKPRGGGYLQSSVWLVDHTHSEPP